jgi:hypothetical protein
MFQVNSISKIVKSIGIHVYLNQNTFSNNMIFIFKIILRLTFLSLTCVLSILRHETDIVALTHTTTTLVCWVLMILSLFSMGSYADIGYAKTLNPSSKTFHFLLVILFYSFWLFQALSLVSLFDHSKGLHYIWFLLWGIVAGVHIIAYMLILKYPT